MCITELFEKVGAPLGNPRWSWGGVRQDGAVVLRVWQNEARWIDGKTYVQLTHHNAFHGRETDLGYQERLSHMAQIQNGASCYFVMCEPRDPEQVPRQIKKFNEKELFQAGNLFEIGEDLWAPIVARVQIR